MPIEFEPTYAAATALNEDAIVPVPVPPMISDAFKKFLVVALFMICALVWLRY